MLGGLDDAGWWSQIGVEIFQAQDRFVVQLVGQLAHAINADADHPRQSAYRHELPPRDYMILSVGFRPAGRKPTDKQETFAG